MRPSLRLRWLFVQVPVLSSMTMCIKQIQNSTVLSLEELHKFIFRVITVEAIFVSVNFRLAMWPSSALKNLLIEFWTKAFHVKADSVKWSQIWFYLLLVCGAKWEYTAWLLPSVTSLKNASCIYMYWIEGSFFSIGRKIVLMWGTKENGNRLFVFLML